MFLWFDGYSQRCPFHQGRETTLGLAAGVESMSLKYVFVVLVQSRFSSPTQPKTYSRSFCLSRRESGGP